MWCELASRHRPMCTFAAVNCLRNRLYRKQGAHKPSPCLAETSLVPNWQQHFRISSEVQSTLCSWPLGLSIIGSPGVSKTPWKTCCHRLGLQKETLVSQIGICRKPGWEDCPGNAICRWPPPAGKFFRQPVFNSRSRVVHSCNSRCGSTSGAR